VRSTSTPSFTLTRIAKIALGALVGLAALAALSLLWLALRVRRRGGVGRKASALLRTLYPLLLGLGGWSAAMLLVQSLAPTVPLDSELLALLSIGLPVGLGIYGAWFRRALAPAARTAGLVAALAGAVAGAWLGFQATAGLMAVPGTILGATAGANLILLVLDSARDRAAQGHVVRRQTVHSASSAASVSNSGSRAIRSSR
jgi:hypothetical protein